MSAQIIDGKKIASEIRLEIKKEVDELKKTSSVTPGLAVPLIGDNPASHVYVRMKKKACEELGIYSQVYNVPKTSSQKEVLSLVKKLNNDTKIHGILVQLPLPDHIAEDTIIEAIDPKKDVDGFHPINVGNMLIGKECFLPCTPWGVQQLLVRSGIELEGAHCVIVGRSNIVGKPLAAILIQKSKQANATVTICHSRTKNLADFTREADILIAAIGRPLFITEDMVSSHAIVIDVGVNRVSADNEKGYRLVGDVDFENVSKKVKAITPVPGGVGPMTIAMLMKNTLTAAQKIQCVEASL
ncbi:bifunctional methylenetetrahydrofolate dehydrogenase/methenyltetrahydrofolate cyclohydrolase FolD [Chlamydiota bacterium]